MKSQTIDATDAGSLKDSVVKLFVTRSEPDYIQPWQMKNQTSATGSGAIIEGKRILTNAHVVSDQVFIQVLRSGQTKKFTAKVEFVAHDCDLALLSVDDEEFFKNSRPLKIGKSPNLRDKVAVYGFPKGGQKLSITEGVVSRIEIRSYTHSHYNILSMQIDAAINSGNSGGPVVKDNEIVGVAFQTGEGESLGYAVPVSVIEHFMLDIKDGRYDGISYVGIEWETTESDPMQAYYGLSTEQSGVLLTKVLYNHSAYSLLKEGDVLVEIDKQKVAADGTIDFENGDRIAFTHALIKYQIGEDVIFKVIRDKKPLEVKIKLGDFHPLVPRPIYDRKPTFYLFAGMIFLPLTENYMELWKDWKSVPANYRYYYSFGYPSPERSEVVILSQILAHDISLGYHSFSDLVVSKINGKPIGSMKDLLAALKTPVGKFHIIECEDGKQVIIDATKAEAAHKEIMERYGIPKDRSDDLK
jgi:S1-C subfamily serine protease